MYELSTNIPASINAMTSTWKGFSLPKTPPSDIITAAAENPPLSMLKQINKNDTGETTPNRVV